MLQRDERMKETVMNEENGHSGSSIAPVFFGFFFFFSFAEETSEPPYADCTAIPKARRICRIIFNVG